MPEVDQIDPLGMRAQRGGDVLQPQRREGRHRTARALIGKDAQDVAKHGLISNSLRRRVDGRRLERTTAKGTRLEGGIVAGRSDGDKPSLRFLGWFQGSPVNEVAPSSDAMTAP